MNQKVRIGIIGLGGISVVHVPYMRQNERAELTAICDIDEPWLRYEKERLGVKYAYADYRDLINNPEIDAVIICLPTYLHAEATIASLNAGKHVLCQKPMACSAAEARAMCAASEKAGKKLMISHNQRLEENVQYIKRLKDEGFFGEIYLMRIGWRRPMGCMPPSITKRPNGQEYNRNFFNEKDNGGGVLRDLGTHLLDLSLFIAGFPKPVDVASSLFRKFYPDDYDPKKYIYDAEDMGVAHINFDNGLTMQLEVSFGSQVERDLVFTEVYGTKAGASRRQGKLQLITYEHGGTVVKTVEKYGFVSKPTAHRFTDAILDGTDVPITAREGAQVVEVLDMIYKAAGKIKT